MYDLKSAVSVHVPTSSQILDFLRQKIFRIHVDSAKEL
jgi:hypothetical protein